MYTLNKVGSIREHDMDIIELENKYYTLHGWNGESYTDCWEVSDTNGTPVDSNDKYIIKAVYDWDNCPAYEDGGYDIDQLQQLFWNIERIKK